MIENMLYSKNYIHPITGQRPEVTLSIGAAGTGSDKTYRFVSEIKELIDSNIVVISTKDDILKQTKDSLKNKGYEVKVFDFNSLDTFPHYNPLSLLSLGYDAFDVAFTLITLINDNFSSKKLIRLPKIEKEVLEVYFLSALIQWASSNQDTCNLLAVYNKLNEMILHDNMRNTIKHLDMEPNTMLRLLLYSEEELHFIASNLCEKLSSLNPRLIQKTMLETDSCFPELNSDKKLAIFVIYPVCAAYKSFCNIVIAGLSLSVYSEKWFMQRTKYVRYFIDEYQYFEESAFESTLAEAVKRARTHMVTIEIAAHTLNQLSFYNNHLFMQSNIIYYHSDCCDKNILSFLLNDVWRADEDTKDYVYENLHSNQCLLYVDGEIVIDDKLPIQ